MDFSQLRDRVRALLTLGGWSNSEPAPDYAFLVNEGLRQFTLEAQHNAETVTVTTVIGTKEYSLLLPANDNRSWVHIFDDASYGTTQWLPQTARDDLIESDPLWRQAASSTPNWWYWAGPNKIGLHPTPSAVASVYFNGIRHEPVLDADDDTPLAQEEFHEGIALFGAWYHGKLYARGDELAICDRYLAEAKSIAGRCKETEAAKEGRLLVRDVPRTPTEYLGFGSSLRLYTR